MILSQQAQEAFDRIRKKIEIRAIDFKGEQLNDLAVVYFEITKHSTGRGRILSKGCSGCIHPAVNICYNYLQSIPVDVVVEEPAKVITVSVDDWNDLTKAELWSQITKRGLSAPATANKKTLISILNGGK